MKSILVIAAHQDDETLGCGGTMARLAREGKAVHAAFVADGVGSRIANGLPDQQALALRRLAAANACVVSWTPNWGEAKPLGGVQ